MNGGCGQERGDVREAEKVKFSGSNENESRFFRFIFWILPSTKSSTSAEKGIETEYLFENEHSVFALMFRDVLPAVEDQENVIFATDVSEDWFEIFRAM